MNIKKNAAFTLIELLVVVLIIGILAAVALPSYRKAVIKTRVMTLMPLLRSISDAQNRFFMANGRYTTSFEALDIAMPAGGQLNTVGGDSSLKYNDFSCVLRQTAEQPVSGASVYCSSQAEGSPRIEKYYQRNSFICWARADSVFEQETCYDISGKTQNDTTASSAGLGFYF